jgi:hypothetical protein
VYSLVEDAKVRTARAAGRGNDHDAAVAEPAVS